MTKYTAMEWSFMKGVYHNMKYFFKYCIILSVTVLVGLLSIPAKQSINGRLVFSGLLGFILIVLEGYEHYHFIGYLKRNYNEYFETFQRNGRVWLARQIKRIVRNPTENDSTLVDSCWRYLLISYATFPFCVLILILSIFV